MESVIHYSLTMKGSRIGMQPSMQPLKFVMRRCCVNHCTNRARARARFFLGKMAKCTVSRIVAYQGVSFYTVLVKYAG